VSLASRITAPRSRSPHDGIIQNSSHQHATGSEFRVLVAGLVILRGDLSRVSVLDLARHTPPGWSAYRVARLRNRRLGRDCLPAGFGTRRAASPGAEPAAGGGGPAGGVAVGVTPGAAAASIKRSYRKPGHALAYRRDGCSLYPSRPAATGAVRRERGGSGAVRWDC
jgi:hypothetical protein